MHSKKKLYWSFEKEDNRFLNHRNSGYSQQDGKCQENNREFDAQSSS